MATDEQRAFLHEATDKLFEEAKKELADLISRYEISMQCKKTAEAYSLISEITVLDGFPSRGELFDETTKSRSKKYGFKLSDLVWSGAGA